MEIYVVQVGDNIYTIAEKYGVSAETLLYDNDIDNPDKLVVGQALLIAYPKQLHTVQQGDTLQGIAEMYQISVMQLYRNNPYLSDVEALYPGQTLVISYDTKRNLTTNGFAFPYIDKNILIKTLPNLTYLSIFNYRLTEDMEIITYFDDTEIIRTTKSYGTIPLLLFSVLTIKGEIDYDTAYRVILNEENQNKIIKSLLSIVREKGYYGVNWVLNVLNSDTQSGLQSFMKKLSDSLKAEGLILFITINFTEAIINEKIDYSQFLFYSDDLMFIKLGWSLNTNPPSPVSNINEIRAILDNASLENSADKLIIGMPTIGYDWQLPYTPNRTVAVSINYNSVIELAYEVNVSIQFDETSQTPYFNYNQSQIGIPVQHIVWFIDVRSINALLQLIIEKNLIGSGIWNIMVYSSQIWMPINTQFNIIKLI